jgi:uncharacterized membrane protein
MEAYGIRGKGWIRSTVRLLGIAAVLLGAYNFLASPFLVTPEFFTTYREIAGIVLIAPSPILSDIGLMVIGAVVAWFV